MIISVLKNRYTFKKILILLENARVSAFFKKKRK